MGLKSVEYDIFTSVCGALYRRNKTFINDYSNHGYYFNGNGNGNTLIANNKDLINNSFYRRKR